MGGGGCDWERMVANGWWGWMDADGCDWIRSCQMQISVKKNENNRCHLPDMDGTEHKWNYLVCG